MENIDQLKVEQLKKICRENKLPIYGKKSELIERICKFRSQNENSIESISQSTISSSASGFSLSDDLELIQNKSFSAEKEDDESSEPSTSSKRTRIVLSWKCIKSFNNEVEAVDFANKNSWKYKKTHDGKQGDKDFYRCSINYHCEAAIQLSAKI